MIDITPEQIAKNYAAAMDSVNLINGAKPAGTSDTDWTETLTRNKDHLKIMVAKDYWTDQDLAPLHAAAA